METKKEIKFLIIGDDHDARIIAEWLTILSYHRVVGECVGTGFLFTNDCVLVMSKLDAIIFSAPSLKSRESLSPVISTIKKISDFLHPRQPLLILLYQGNEWAQKEIEERTGRKVFFFKGDSSRGEETNVKALAEKIIELVRASKARLKMLVWAKAALATLVSHFGIRKGRKF